MALPQEKIARYTYADALAWEESDRIELVDGEAFMMAPPSTAHQAACMALSAQLYNYLVGKRCQVFPAPFGVRLFEEDGDFPEDVDTLVEPDISVVCDRSKLDDRGCKGAPDLVIEVLSPATQRHDRLTKFDLYQRSGVQEYWIVDLDARVVLVHTLEEGRYHSPLVYPAHSSVPVGVLEECTVDLGLVFAK